jgi:hypothetical protein
MLEKGSEMSAEDDAKRVIDATLEHAKDLRPCLLCGSLTHMRGIFNPQNSQKFGAKEGKSRYIIYVMCERHPRNEKTAQKVESKIYQEYRTV